MIFQGQEFLSWDPFNPPNPLDWSHLKTFGGIVQLYSDLIKLRRNWYNSTRGLNGQGTNVFHVNNTNKVIAFHRWDQGGPGDDVVVVLNFGNQGYPSYSIGLPQGGHWQVRFNSDASNYDPSFSNWFSYGTDASGGPQDNLPFSGNVGLGPYSAIILTQ
jgi:1,4-alpha-glucan branching enzyme